MVCKLTPAFLESHGRSEGPGTGKLPKKELDGWHPKQGAWTELKGWYPFCKASMLKMVVETFFHLYGHEKNAS